MYLSFLLLLPLIAHAKLSIRKEHGVRVTGPVNARAAIPEWGGFVQKLDHFNPLDTRNWTMVRFFLSQNFCMPFCLNFFLCLINLKKNQEHCH